MKTNSNNKDTAAIYDRLRNSNIVEFASPELTSEHVVRLFDTFIGGPFTITTEDGDEEIQQSSTRVYVVGRTTLSPIPVILDSRAFASAPPSARALYSLFLVFAALRHGDDTVALREEIRRQFSKAFPGPPLAKKPRPASVRTVLRCLNGYLRSAPLSGVGAEEVTLAQCPSLGAVRNLPSTQECMAAKALAVVVAHASVNGRDRGHVLASLDAVAAMLLPHGTRVLLPRANRSLVVPNANAPPPKNK
jgi:hypothetical protein